MIGGGKVGVYEECSAFIRLRGKVALALPLKSSVWKVGED